MKRISLVVLVISSLLIAASASAEPLLGERLEREMWALIKAGDWSQVESLIAPGFQSSHQDGARDRAAEMKVIKGLNLGEYKLDRFVVTESGPVIVVTYFVAVKSETIKGQVLPAAPAQRLSVWLKSGNGWQWMAHANLNPMKK